MNQEKIVEADIDIEAAFEIYSDIGVEEAIKSVKQAEAQAQTYIVVCNAEIERYKALIKAKQDETERTTSYAKQALKEYITHSAIPLKTTKTQSKAVFPAGEVIFKNASEKMIVNEDAALSTLPADSEYIKIERSLRWGEYKKRFTVSGGVVTDKETGEVIDESLIGVEFTPERIEIK
jgi:hypothetical protein